MKTNELIKSADSIYRILSIDGDTAIVLDCIKMTMPVLMPISSLADCPTVSEEELHASFGVHIREVSDLSPAERKTMHERYTLIAPALPFVTDSAMRSMMITRVSEQSGVGKQTIRKHLCRYLALQRMEALAPEKAVHERMLSEDEKNYRWALNKYYYTEHKAKLTYAYTMMLKERYTDVAGQLQDGYPPFHRFRYYYSKHKRPDSALISRNGLSSYQRNSRPLLGSIQDFAPAVGVGMLDATVCDIYLVNDAGQLVGRPILTLCVDAYSRLICGYLLSWEGGIYSLRELLQNVICDKVGWCRRFGISVSPDEWSCSQLPGTLVTDRGTEYVGDTFEQIAELGVNIINLPAFRPELKGIVESAFHQLQELYKPLLKGKGVVEPDANERGVHDYRKDACLTLDDFEKVIIHCIVYYNSKRLLDNFPLTSEMLTAKIKPYSNALWNFGKEQPGAHLIAVEQEQLRLTLLPRTVGKFTRYGLMVYKQRYRHTTGNYTEDYLNGGDAVVAYDSSNMGTVWLYRDGTFTPFELVLKIYDNLTLIEIAALKEKQKEINGAEERSCTQAKIDLATQIETIANTHRHVEIPTLKGIRDRHAMEKKKRRIKNV